MSVWCGDGEPIVRHGTDYRRSKTLRNCRACAEPILPGDYYAREFALYDGSYEITRRCLRCEAIYVELQGMPCDADEGIAPALNCGHTWEENFDEPPPLHVARLAFMTRAEMQAEFGSVLAANRGEKVGAR